MPKRPLDSNDKFIKMGEALRILRKKENLTINKLSETLNKSEKIISNYENGYNHMTLETIITIYESDFLNDYSLEELLHIFIIEIFEKDL